MSPSSAVVLSGTAADPDPRAASVVFEYGTSSSYGHATTVQSLSGSSAATTFTAGSRALHLAPITSGSSRWAPMAPPTEAMGCSRSRPGHASGGHHPAAGVRPCIQGDVAGSDEPRVTGHQISLRLGTTRAQADQADAKPKHCGWQHRQGRDGDHHQVASQHEVRASAGGHERRRENHRKHGLLQDRPAATRLSVRNDRRGTARCRSGSRRRSRARPGSLRSRDRT